MAKRTEAELTIGEQMEEREIKDLIGQLDETIKFMGDPKKLDPSEKKLYDRQTKKREALRNELNEIKYGDRVAELEKKIAKQESQNER
jgi:hypothetical protein